MRQARRSLLSITLALLAVLLFALRVPDTSAATNRLCSLLPAPTIALLRVDQDTTLPYAPADGAVLSYSSVRRSAADSLLVMPGDPMPAARVRMLRMDSATRQSLTTAGVADSQPAAFITAAPYRADCRTIRYSDSIPFAVPGQVGFVRASLMPRARWIDGTPVFVIRPVWHFPYPHRRALAFAAAPDERLASAEAMYDLTLTLEIPRHRDSSERAASEHGRRMRALSWARDNARAAELEPARTMVRRAVLDPDWQAARSLTSRVRGTYRVDVDVDGQRGSWYFRTHDRPGYRWDRAESLQTTAALVESPSIAGYLLAGYAAPTLDSLPEAYPRGAVRGPLVWLGTADRPTTPGNASRMVLPGELMFHLGAAPEWLWSALEDLIPPIAVRDSVLMARLNRSIERARLQPRIPLTVRLDSLGGVRADTTLSLRGAALRVVLERVDTLSLARPF